MSHPQKMVPLATKGLHKDNRAPSNDDLVAIFGNLSSSTHYKPRKPRPG